MRVPGGSSLSLVSVCAQKYPLLHAQTRRYKYFAIEVSTDTNAQLPKAHQKFGFPSEFIFVNKYTFSGCVA